MSLTYTQAADEIKAAFWQAWKVNASPIVGYTPDVRWQGKEEPSGPNTSEFWARHSIQSVSEEQRSLSTQVSGPDKRRYEAFGLVFVQLFCPKSITNSNDLGAKLAEVAKSAYRGETTPGGVLFRNVRIVALSDETLFYRYNVVAEYEYDEIG